MKRTCEKRQAPSRRLFQRKKKPCSAASQAALLRYDPRTKRIANGDKFCSRNLMSLISKQCTAYLATELVHSDNCNLQNNQTATS
jgi:hypothetical protein